MSGFDVKAFLKKYANSQGGLEEHQIDQLRSFVEIDEFRMLMKSEIVKETKNTTVKADEGPSLADEALEEAELIFNYTVEQIKEVLADDEF